MHWSALAVSGVVAGALLACGALVPALGARDRVWAAGLGALGVMSGLDTADQPGGTACYPLLSLLITIAGIGYVVHRVRAGSR